MSNEFDPSTVKLFMFRASAWFYAGRARRRGFVAEIKGPHSNWIELGGRYMVKLSLPEKEPANEPS